MSPATRTQSPLIFAAPYIAGLIVQLPLLFGYLLDLGHRPHFGLYFIGPLATILIAAARWPWGQSDIHRGTVGSSLWLIAAIIAGIIGAILVQPWFTALSCILLVASYLAATIEKSGVTTLFSASIPLIAVLRPPLDWDLGLTTRIQTSAEFFASKFMTLISPYLGHTENSSAYIIPGWDPFRFSDSLVGIASVFSLVLVALIYISVTRRTFFQSILLLLSCALWSLVLNVAYLMLLPVLNIYLDYEISAGTSAFNILRLVLLAGAALMVVCTGQFFRFACDPVDPEIGRSYSFGRFFTAVWNRLFASEPFINDTGQIVGRPPKPVVRRQPTMVVRWAAAITLAAVGVMPLISGAKIFDVAANQSTIEFAESDMPTTVDDWAVVEGDFSSEIFDGSSVHGIRQDVWKYQTPVLAADWSIGQPFQMWHELTWLYKIDGWKVVSRELAQLSGGDSGASPSSYVEARLERKTGEKGLLLFTYIDSAGNPIAGPDSWNSLDARIQAASVSPAGPMFQVALFRPHFSELSDDKHSQLTDLFLKLRQAAKDRISKGQIAKPASDVLQPEPTL